MEYQSIKLRGVDLIVGFEVNGKYIPQTHENPAEYPDIILKEVTAKDSEIDLLPMLTEDQEDEIINILYDL